MVPVPVEHQAEMQEYVLRLIINDHMLRWDLPTAETLLADVDAGQREFLRRLTVNSFEHRVASVEEYAAALEVGPDQVVAMASRLNQLAQALGKTAFVFLDDEDPRHALIAPHIAQLLSQALGLDLGLDPEQD
jgi:hypothetical protein